MARAVGEDDADDMTQDVFLKAYRGLPRFRGEAPPRAWLASIADNAVKNRYRSRSRFRRIFAGSSDAGPGPRSSGAGAGPEEDARAGESRRLVAEALRKLAPEFRMPVVLRDLEEWSYEEIAVSLEAARRYRQVAHRPRPRAVEGDPDASSDRKVPMIGPCPIPRSPPEFLSRLHDGELESAEAAAFDSHRRECPECEAAVADFERALAAYRSAPVSPHASDLSARILRKIRATSPSRRPFGVMFGIDLRWAGALAAALLVVIIGAPVFSSRKAKPGIVPAPPPPPASAPIPAYVLDAEEERPAEKRAEVRQAPAAPKVPRRRGPRPTARRERSISTAAKARGRTKHVATRSLRRTPTSPTRSGLRRSGPIRRLRRPRRPSPPPRRPRRKRRHRVSAPAAGAPRPPSAARRERVRTSPQPRSSSS